MSATPRTTTRNGTQEHPMSTTTTSPTRPTTGRRSAPGGGTAYPPQLADVRPVPFVRLLVVELRKLVDTRSGRWLLISILIVTVLAMGVALWLGRETGTDLMTLLATANLPQGVLIPVLGIMTAANEWSQRTALITFTQEPRRLRVMAAKTVAAVLLGLAVLVISSVVAALAHVVSVSVVDGGTVDLAVDWPLVVNLLAIQTLGVLMGVAFGALLLNVPLGIVAYFMVPTVLPLVLMTTSWLREHAAWLDLGTAQSPLLEQGWLSGQQWAQLGTTTALWVLLPLAVGCWRVARREVR